jgi:CheY-like chemotaxis protein/DNA-directed RNA polymerase specialized sigma24 family protein
MTSAAASDIVQTIAANLPYLRRYARALTGNQGTGDRYAVAALEALLEDPQAIVDADSAKIALFRAFHLVWSSAGAPLGQADTELSRRAQNHMASLTTNSREALLLFAIEGFGYDDISRIMQIEPDDASELIDAAKREMLDSVTGAVLVIEDEAIIAIDIQGIVIDMGHRVTGIARTRTTAVDLAARDRPDLILADIQLADKSSGIDAVRDILEQFDDVPVIFITAFPERLLTGQRPEPAFLIAKPYTEDQVRSAVSQAMFFSSTETLLAGPTPKRALG